MKSAPGHRTHDILISGAGTAGQSLAYWLRRHGFRPTVVERAPAPRSGGFAIDLRGAAIPVAEHMGILDDLRRVRVLLREIVHLDRHGEVVWKTDGNFGGGAGLTGDIEILREDLNNIMHAATDQDVEYLFGDTITGIVDDGAGVEVTFERARPRRFDLVIGCDGLHSIVRSLTFGPESQFARPLGYYVAISTIPNLFSMDREWWMYDMPGKMTNVMQYGHDKHTRGMFLFASPPLAYDRDDLAQQKCLVEQAFAGETSWKIPALLDAMRESTDLYFDDVTQIHLPRWSKGRVVLLGDAGYAPTLITGQGTSLAFVGAYVLAGELKTAGGDHNVAFDRYQKVMRSYVEQNQRIALCGELSIPNSWAELEQKNARMREIHHTPDSALAEDSAGALIQNAANAIELADYVHV